MLTQGHSKCEVLEFENDDEGKVTEIDHLLLQVNDKVPVEDDFPVVFEEYEVVDKRIEASYFFLKVTHLNVKDTNNERFLELAVLNHPNPYGVEMAVRCSTKQDILKHLQNPSLADELHEKLQRLIRDLGDVR